MMNRRCVFFGLVLLSSATVKSALFKQVMLRPGVKVDGPSARWLELSAFMKHESILAINPMLLNADLPDSYRYFRSTGDLVVDGAWGEKEFGHDAVRARLDLRYKGYWGASEESVRSAQEEIKVDGAYFDKLLVSAQKPLAWFREMWLSVSVDALAGLKNGGTHTIKVGSFPFILGRGVVLGNGYGAEKYQLGPYNHIGDFSASGIAYSGSVYGGRVSYDLYYAKFDSKTVSPGQVLAQTRSHLVGVTKNKGWRGTDKDDSAIVLRVKVSSKEEDGFGVAYVAPYLMLNRSEDGYVELESDSRRSLATVGCEFDFDCGGLELGGEIAFNGGEEEVRAIDRNVVATKFGLDGAAYPTYSKIFLTKHPFFTYINEAEGVAAQSTRALVAELDANPHKVNSENFSVSEPIWQDFGTGVVDYKVASDRMRNYYKNRYNGWLLIGDIAFKTVPAGFKFAGCVGIASGDDNPYGSEVNKSNSNFIGLHGSYVGKRVKSVFMLGDQFLSRPMVMNRDRSGILHVDMTKTGNSLSDLRFMGVSSSFFPRKFSHKNASIMGNLLMFWTDFEQMKPNSDLRTQSSEAADRFLGTEFNLQTTVDILTDLKLVTVAAVFFPGAYYNDIKGVKIAQQLDDLLNRSDPSNLDAAVYPIGNDTAFFISCGIEYRF